MTKPAHHEPASRICCFQTCRLIAYHLHHPWRVHAVHTGSLFNKGTKGKGIFSVFFYSLGYMDIGIPQEKCGKAVSQHTKCERQQFAGFTQSFTL